MIIFSLYVESGVTVTQARRRENSQWLLIILLSARCLVWYSMEYNGVCNLNVNHTCPLSVTDCDDYYHGYRAYCIECPILPYHSGHSNCCMPLFAKISSEAMWAIR